MRQWTGVALVQVMACRLFGAKPSPEPMLPYCQMDLCEQTFSEIWIKIWNFSFNKIAPAYVVCEMAAIMSMGDE